MDQGSMTEKVLQNGREVAMDHVKMLDKLFDTPHFPADELTEYYAKTRSDILTPGYEPGREKLKKLVQLAEAFRESKRYIAVVRAIVGPKVRHANAISYPDGKELRYASIRVFEDLTADKVSVFSDFIQTMTANDSVVEPYAAILFNAPSIGISTETKKVLKDEDSAILESTHKSSYDFFATQYGYVEEEVPFDFITADSTDELVKQLQLYGQSDDFQFGYLGDLTDEIESALITKNHA